MQTRSPRTIVGFSPVMPSTKTRDGTGMDEPGGRGYRGEEHAAEGVPRGEDRVDDERVSLAVADVHVEALTEVPPLRGRDRRRDSHCVSAQ